MTENESLQLDARRTALIIQDLQNDVKTLADAFRRAGGAVIHVWYIVEEGAPGLKQNAPLFQGVKEGNGLVRGSWGAAPADGLEPQDGDHVVEKMRMSAWEGTKLEVLLAGLGVDTVVVTG